MTQTLAHYIGGQFTGASAALWTGMEGMTEILLLALTLWAMGPLMRTAVRPPTNSA